MLHDRPEDTKAACRPRRAAGLTSPKRGNSGQAEASDCKKKQTEVRQENTVAVKDREQTVENDEDDGEEEEEEEERKTHHRSRPWAQAPETKKRLCFAVKEGLQPGGTDAFMPPRLYRRAAHGKS